MVSLPIPLFFRFPNGSFCRCQLFFQQMQNIRAASGPIRMLIFAITVGHRAGHLTNLPDGARTVSDCIQNILLGHLVAVTNILHFSSNPSTRKKGR